MGNDNETIQSSASYDIDNPDDSEELGYVSH